MLLWTEGLVSNKKTTENFGGFLCLDVA